MSCVKKGCTDINSDNFSSQAKKNDNSCLYRNMNMMSIIMPYSIYGVEDLRVYIKLFKKNDNGVIYNSDITTASYNTAFQFEDEFYFTNEIWTMEVWIIDSSMNEKRAIASDFNPFEIQPTSAQSLIRFNTVKDQDFYQVSMYYNLK